KCSEVLLEGDVGSSEVLVVNKEGLDLTVASFNAFLKDGDREGTCGGGGGRVGETVVDVEAKGRTKQRRKQRQREKEKRVPMNPRPLQNRVATAPSQPDSRCCECDYYGVVV
ncbi:hypothetical protein HN51_056127, partial [Arachis hypogaea]